MVPIDRSCSYATLQPDVWVPGDFYWRVSIDGGVLSRPERGRAVFED
jgi:hypothetical protein